MPYIRRLLLWFKFFIFSPIPEKEIKRLYSFIMRNPCGDEDFEYGDTEKNVGIGMLRIHGACVQFKMTNGLGFTLEEVKNEETKKVRLIAYEFQPGSRLKLAYIEGNSLWHASWVYSLMALHEHLVLGDE